VSFCGVSTISAWAVSWDTDDVSRFLPIFCEFHFCLATHWSRLASTGSIFPTKDWERVNRMTSRTSFLRIFSAALCLSLLSQAASPQSAPLLISDSLTVDPERQVFTATGNVEVYFDGAKLTAPSVTYDQGGDRFSIEGPFVLSDASGTSVTYGEFAELSPDLAEGVIYAVRQVIEDNLQVAARQVTRSGGRLTEFSRVRASSCRICSGSDIPIWEVRAEEAVHDEEAKTVTYRHAQLRIRDIPVAYTPWLRMPDPSVTRADGFLPPTLTVNSRLGSRIGLPYFKTLGDYADVTVAPNIAIGGSASQTVEGRYRQFFHNGYVELNGAVSSDELTDDGLRAFLFTNGHFLFESGVDLKFQSQSASDRTYIGTYDFFARDRKTFRGDEIIFEDDRLRDNVTISRHRDGEVIEFSYAGFTPLRDPTYLYDGPNRVVNSQWMRELNFGELPGTMRLSVVGQVDANDFGSTNARQVDIARGSVNLSWRDSRDVGEQLKLYSDVGVFLDSYRVFDDVSWDATQSGAAYLVATKLARPIAFEGSDRGAASLVPSLQFMTFKSGGLSLPTVDGSTIDLLDPYNYSNLNRFRRLNRDQNVAYDVTTLEADLTYRYRFVGGVYFGAGVNQDFVLSSSDVSLDDSRIYSLDFGREGSGLTYSLTSKFNQDADRIYDAASFSAPIERFTVSGAYLRQDVDPAFANALAVERWSVDISAPLTPHLSGLIGTTFNALATDDSFATAALNYDDGEVWRASISGRYDRDLERYDQVDAEVRRRMDWGGDLYAVHSDDFDTTNRLGVGLEYSNECVEFLAGVTRVQNATTGLDATTELSIELRLGSFGAERARTCG